MMQINFKIYVYNISELVSYKSIKYVLLIWFGLVSLFNGMSTFVGYLMPKLFS